MDGGMTDNRHGLDHLFRPRSVAIVGASSNPSKIGGIPVDYLKSQGYPGRIIPVNPNADEIQGLRAWPNLRDVPEPVDLAVIAVPSAMVEAAVEDAAAAGVKGLVIFSSGFAEIGDEGEAVQARIAARAKQAGMRILGPNCLGYMNFAENLFPTFSPVVKHGRPKPGKVAIVSQSGAFGGYALSLARRKGIGISHWITTGNEAELDFAECMEWLAEDPGTEVILGYMEGCRDGNRLRRAFLAAERAGKLVIIAKVGRSEEGAAAAASHTAALAGEDAVFDGIFRQYGVLRGDSIEDCLDMAYAASIAPLPQGRRAGVFTISGGAGILMADEAIARGMEVPELSAQAQAKVRELVPFAAPRNPLDITGQIMNDVNAFGAALGAMTTDGSCDVLLTFLAATGLSHDLGPALGKRIGAAKAAAPEVPNYVVTICEAELREYLESVGCPVFEDPSRATKAAAALSTIGARRRKDVQMVIGVPEGSGSAQLSAATTEPEALSLLADAGLPVMPFRIAVTAEEAGKAAEALGGPVAIKIVSPDILHKTEMGGVRLGLVGAEDAASAAQEILDSVTVKAPDARIEGVMIAPMIKGSAECVIGVQRDPVFGPVVMFGMGGVHVEALRDVTFRAAPLDEAEARAMIGEIRALKLLTHPRGAEPADLDAIARLIAQVSRFAAEHAETVETLDLNPVIVTDEGVTIVDALIRTR